jgi:hypothetical protein
MGVILALGFMSLIGLAGAAALFSQGWRARRGRIVSGTVVATVRERIQPYVSNPNSLRDAPTYAPVVEFTDDSGQTHQVKANLSGTMRPAIGQSVKVSYRPGNPQKAIVMELPGQAPAKWVFLVVGVGCLAGAIVVATH